MTSRSWVRPAGRARFSARLVPPAGLLALALSVSACADAEESGPRLAVDSGTFFDHVGSAPTIVLDSSGRGQGVMEKDIVLESGENWLAVWCEGKGGTVQIEISDTVSSPFPCDGGVVTEYVNSLGIAQVRTEMLTVTSSAEVSDWRIILARAQQ